MKKLVVSLLFAMLFCTVPLAVNADASQIIDVDPNTATSDMPDAQAALESAMVDAVRYEVQTVRLKEGTWNISRTIIIPGGVTLDLNGQTVNASNVKYAFRLDPDGSSIVNGTIRNGGIQVNGGDSEGEISGVTVVNAPDIAILAANSSAIGCISDNTISGSAGYGIRFFGKSRCGNIENNTITGTGDHAISVTGSGADDDGCTVGDIINNTIRDCRAHGISIYFGSHVGRITGNYLENIGGRNDNTTGDYAITVNSSSPYNTYAAEITNNTIKNARYASIVVYSERKGSNSAASRHKGYIVGDIANNTIIASGTIKKKVKWGKDNSYDCQGAIYVASYADVRGSIHDNTIQTSYDDGINIRAGATVYNNIYSNNISNTGNAGIAAKQSAVIKGNIYNNKINSSGLYGFFVNTDSDVRGSVYGNTISNIGQYGVLINNKAKVNVLTGNTITGVGIYGIITNNGSRINEVSSNSIVTTDAKKGMGIISNTGSYIPLIRGNNISGKYNSGIRVKSPTGKVKVIGNVLKSGNSKKIRSTGISVEGCRKKTITIMSNRITGNRKGAGIYLKTSAAKIKKNKIIKCQPKKSIKKGKYKVVQ